MLTEVPARPDDEPGRRWFRGDALELVVWTDHDGVRQYQLRYSRGSVDGVFEWRRPGTLHHYHLDDGEGRAARVDATPVLTPASVDEAPGLDWVRMRFREESEGLDAELRTRVETTLAEARPD